MTNASELLTKHDADPTAVCEACSNGRLAVDEVQDCGNETSWFMLADNSCIKICGSEAVEVTEEDFRIAESECGSWSEAMQ